MLKNYVPSKIEHLVEYELCFDDGHNNGYGFPCDASGNLLNEEQRETVAWLLERPQMFSRFNEVVRFERKYREPARGTCICGRELTLYDEYYGACSCECGRWYNLFGQELLPPEQWEMEPYEEEYW